MPVYMRLLLMLGINEIRGLIVNTKVAVPVPALLVAFKPRRIPPGAVGAVGVPMMRFVTASKTRPAGSGGGVVTLKLVGLFEASSWYEKGVPTTPWADKRLLVKTGRTTAGPLIVRFKVAVPVPSALVARMVMLYGPAVVGVPEMTPVTGLSDRPAGKMLVLKLVGLLVAMIS